MNLLFIFLSTLFVDANALYAEGNYAEAAAVYEQVVVDQPSAEVYYNLGNAYFKQGELAQSILAYERALRLKPSYKDAQYNLHFAQSRIVDNIEDTHSFFLSNWMRAVRNALSMQVWMWLSIPTAQLNKENIAQILRDKAVNDELINEVYQVLTTAEFARYAPTTDHAMQDMYDTTTRLINALEDQKL